MKAIMISIQPQHVADILNGRKTLEIRKTCPEVFKHLKPYEGASYEVYIYCTKEKDDLFWERQFGKYAVYFRHNQKFHKTRLRQEPHNGKVVAKFTLNKVEDISDYLDSFVPKNATFSKPYRLEGQKELLKHSCLTEKELTDYLKSKNGYAWHIDNLVILDKPKEISEFKHWVSTLTAFNCLTRLEPLTRAPQSWCYIEV